MSWIFNRMNAFVDTGWTQRSVFRPLKWRKEEDWCSCGDPPTGISREP
jgi:hypothetical protein